MISFLILERVIAHLKATVNVGIATGNHQYVRDIKLGRIQTDPTGNYVYLTISGGDPEKPNLRDAIVGHNDEDKIAWSIVPREVGNVEYWWRRGMVSINCYYISQGLDEITSARHAYSVLNRVEEKLRACDVRGLRTEHEQAIKLFTFATEMFGSGGPPSQYIWKGAIRFQVLTERLLQ